MEVKARDAGYAGIGIALLILILALGLVAALFLWPIFFGGALAIGAFFIISLLIGLAIALLSIFYIAYSIVKYAAEGESKKTPERKEYSIDGIKPS